MREDCRIIRRIVAGGRTIFGKSDIVDRMDRGKKSADRERERERDEGRGCERGGGWPHGSDFVSFRQAPGFRECFFDPASHSRPRPG